MRIFFIFLLLTSSHAFAQKRLNADSFKVNVRPILNGILSDFYQMITLFPDFPKELIPVIKELDSITTEKEILVDNCPRVLNDKCLEQIDILRSKLRNLKELSFILLSRQPMASTLYLNSISGIKTVNNFDAQLELVKGQLDNASFLIKAKLKDKVETYSILKEVDELNPLLSLALVEFIPYTYRVDFRHFYFNFVHPIQQQISKNINYEFLNRNVNSLNFAINLLNMNLTKRNKKTPDGMGPYLATIHNRWNSILRYYF